MFVSILSRHSFSRVYNGFQIELHSTHYSYNGCGGMRAGRPMPRVATRGQLLSTPVFPPIMVAGIAKHTGCYFYGVSSLFSPEDPRIPRSGCSRRMAVSVFLYS